MSKISKISGVFEAANLRRLTWPIAWTSDPDDEALAAFQQLADEGLRLLDSVDLATAVEIKDGEIISVIVDEGATRKRRKRARDSVKKNQHHFLVTGPRGASYATTTKAEAKKLTRNGGQYRKVAGPMP